MTSPAKNIVLASLGIFFIIIYFYIFNGLQSFDYLKIQIPPEDFLHRADSLFQQSPLSEKKIYRHPRTDLNKDVYHYLQLKHSGNTGFIPVARFQVFFTEDVFAEMDEPSGEFYRIWFDFRGQMVGFNKNFQEEPDTLKISEKEARRIAVIFLAERSVDTTSLVLREKNIRSVNQKITHVFTFRQPSGIDDALQKVYKFEITGAAVKSFEEIIELDKEKFQFSGFSKISTTTGEIAGALIWMSVFIIMLVQFIRRLRHDEIEFRHAYWIAGAVFLIMSIVTALETYPSWTGMLVGGLIGGLLLGLLFLIIFPTFESLSRDAWSQKLILLDSVFQGRFKNREIGAAILNSIFLIGISFLLYGMILKISDLPAVYLTFEKGFFWVLDDSVKSVSIIFQNLFQVFFGVFLFIGIFSSFLKLKTHSRLLMIGLLSVASTIIILDVFFTRPVYLNMLLLFHLGLLWAFLIEKYDFLTILFTLIGVFIIADLTGILVLNDPLHSFPAVAGILGLMIIFTTGIIFVFSSRTVTDYDGYTPEYVSRIAEKERLLKELEIARDVQTKFLPQQTPQFSGLDIASICQPAYEVGGDYYDFISTGSHYFSVVIGDVSGKGVSAAFYMTMAKGILKTLTKTIQDPCRLLAEVNRIFYENAPRNVFISLIYGLFDLKNKKLSFARAGHNPLIVWKGRGEKPQVLYPRGLAIGLDRGNIFEKNIEEKEIAFEEGDVFLFYTDGISEAMNTTGEEFGEERLLEILTENGQATAEEIKNKIINKVNLFSDKGLQRDDITLVVVKITTG